MASKLVKTHHLRTLTTSRTVSICRRKLHESVYEKEVEEEVEATPPVEDILHEPEEYWEPDPDTGVFVPASEQNSEEPAVTCTTEETVLDEKAFFRPQEDLEPPPTESFTGEIPPVDPFAD
ncbi:late embryogenesis abundant protein At5g17165-like [Bidens hawaiensis]|uniref:late embryogenesis abundant protein At5g17165-like n=1 Tax=Bidens hawaiensis TaxID=980011 RepID=UPI004049DAD0